MERNDLEAAVAYYKAELEENGKVSEETAETLIMLQDDPAELIAKLLELEEEAADAK